MDKQAQEMLKFSLRAGACGMREFIKYALWLRRERPAIETGHIQAGDIKIFYRDYGRGDAVVMLPGGFMTAETWAAQIPALARGYRVVTMDPRGHGRTTLGTRPQTFRQMAEDAAGLIEGLGLDRAHLVGLSDGGTTCIAMALQRPDLMRSMTLVGTPFNTDNYTEEARRKIEAVLKPNSFGMLYLRATRRMMTPEPERGAEFLAGMTRMWRELPDFTLDELSGITIPALVIGCDKDEFLSLKPDPFQIFRETADAIPGATMAVIKGGTHSVTVDHPAEFNRILLDFLQGV